MLRSVIGLIVALWGALLLYGGFTSSAPDIDEPIMYTALRPPYDFHIIGFATFAGLMVIAGTSFFVTGLKRLK